MQNLTRASNELFRRTQDERFGSLVELWQHCQNEKEQSIERWHPPQVLVSQPADSRLTLAMGEDGSFGMTDWSFSQLCKLADVSKDTLNKLTPDTASRVLGETLPSGTKPLQALTTGQTVRAIHQASYTRLYNADLLTMVREFATDFVPPQPAGIDVARQSVAEDDIPFDPDPEPTPASGLYCGEQDMFCFLIDPTGWTEIEGEAFAPGFFLWNSEVGKRSVGVQTFWFQAVCQNHIVWDAVEVVEFSRKHTANVHDSLREIRRLVEGLVEKRDQRRDGFVRVIRKAMETKLGDDADEVMDVLNKRGITRKLAKEAIEVARQQGGLTIFAVVDALTRIAGNLKNGGDRTEADARASALLTLAAVA
ncbi:MAG: DUF932 domain-containing protein [Phycisphaerae bacterium]|nr:DUF932 domain-containing protein [Phycisphaerae bacterium]